jgi:hypothetical protein
MQDKVGSLQSAVGRMKLDSELRTRTTAHYLLFVEHPPVYTLGKSGNIENVLMSEDQLEENGFNFSEPTAEAILPFTVINRSWVILFSILKNFIQILANICGT